MAKRSLNQVWTAAVFIAGILTVAVPAAAATIAVTSIQDELPIDTHNGTCTLREAITAANTDQKVDACASGFGNTDTILLQPMSYILKDAVKISSAITIQGKESTEIDPKSGKPKRSTLLRSSADPKKFSLVIVKEGGLLNIYTILLTGGDTDAGVGGAINVDGGQLTAANVGFVGNKALQGGAIYSWNSKVSLSNVLFNGNFAKDGGGSIRAIGGNLTITEAQFEKNSSGASNGGAVFADSAALVIDKAIFTQNSTSGNGAALFVSGFSAPQLASIVNATFYKNTAGGVGGAIYSSLNGKSLNVVNTALVENSAKDGGAAYIVGKASFVNATLGKNTATQTGGAVKATNSAQITFTHATIAENAAKVSGGGVFAESNAKVEIRGSVITGNTAEDSAKDYAGPFVSKGHNLISQVPTNFGQFEADSTDIVGKFGEATPFEMSQVLSTLLGGQTPAAWYYPLVAAESLSAVNKDMTDYCKYFNLCVEEKLVDGQVMCAQDIQPLLSDQVGNVRDGQCDSGSIEYTSVVVAEAPAADAAHPEAADASHPSVTEASLPNGTDTTYPTQAETTAATDGHATTAVTDSHATTDAHSVMDARAVTDSQLATDTHTVVDSHAAPIDSHVETVASHDAASDSHADVDTTRDTEQQVADRGTLPQVFEKPVSSESWMDSVLRTNAKPLTSSGTIDQFLGSATTASTTKGVHGSETWVAARDSHTTAPHPSATDNRAEDTHAVDTRAADNHAPVASHATETPRLALDSHGVAGSHPVLEGTRPQSQMLHGAEAQGHGASDHPIPAAVQAAKDAVQKAKEVDAKNIGTLNVDIQQADAQGLDTQKDTMGEGSPYTQGEVVAVNGQTDAPSAGSTGGTVASNDQPSVPSAGNGSENFQGAPASMPADAAPAAAGGSGGCSLIRQ